MNPVENSRDGREKSDNSATRGLFEPDFSARREPGVQTNEHTNTPAQGELLRAAPKIDDIKNVAPVPVPSRQFRKFMEPAAVGQNSSLNTSARPSTLPSSISASKNIPDVQLKRIPIEKPNPKITKRNILPNWLHDLIGIVVFVVVVVVGAWLINTFVFQSYNVVGPSSYPTLNGNDGSISGYPTDQIGTTSDRLIVNLLPVTLDKIQGKNYIPERGQFIVFRNPNWSPGASDEYVVKRVIGLPGETVKVENKELKVYNASHPNGFNPYKDTKDYPLFKSVANPDVCVSGEGTDVSVPRGNIFVVGDNRCDFQYNGQMIQPSEDSRNGSGRPSLGTIPLNMIIGPVSVRIWPIDKIRFF